MLRIELKDRTAPYCDGIRRRSFLQLGATGLLSGTLGSVLEARESSGSGKNTSVILLWLDGGPGHMDLYDMKPEAPPEYRGIWSPIRTNVPGMEISELFPLQAKVADKFSLVRSLHHNSGDHFTGGHWMLTGRGSGVSGGSNAPRSPFFGAIACDQAGARQPGMPANVAIPHAMSIGLRPGYFGGNYLGIASNPFDTGGNPDADNFQVRNIALEKSLSIQRLESRRLLQQELDGLRRTADQQGLVESMSAFEQRAYELVSGPKAREAFDLSSEDPKLRERYGRHPWGQGALLARLVEAGTTFVTCHLGGWDHHWNLQSGMERYLPQVDQLVSALFTDLADRGLDQQVLVVLCGEFSRTPRMNDGGNGGPPLSKGTPGRDHWGNSMFCLLGGGGVQGGRVIGSTNRLGEEPKDHPLRPGDIHHTIFRVLGVDPHRHYPDHSGRPVAAIDHGAPIEELF